MLGFIGSDGFPGRDFRIDNKFAVNPILLDKMVVYMIFGRMLPAVWKGLSVESSVGKTETTKNTNVHENPTAEADGIFIFRAKFLSRWNTPSFRVFRAFRGFHFRNAG